MKYVIQHNLLNVDHVNQIKAAIDKHSLPHIYVGIIPFSHEITSNEELVGVDYIPYGSTSFTMATHNLGWRANYFNPVTFRSNVWNDNRDDMLNSNAPTTVVEAVEFLRTQDPTSLWFTRPTEDLKTYSGQVIEAKECADWFVDAMECASSGSYQLSPDTPIMLSQPQNIQAEWRWFVIGGKIVDGSMYKSNNQLVKIHEVHPAVIAEAQWFADKWLPAQCCVMDLALVGDRLKVVEFNTINSTGFYDHDIEKIFVALYDYACNH